MSIAIEVVLLNLIFIWGGIKLDEFVDGWSPFFLILGVIFGTASTIYYLLVKLNK